jgi:hypothetical protein
MHLVMIPNATLSARAGRCFWAKDEGELEPDLAHGGFFFVLAHGGS